jgi:hypothetical protein
LVFHPPTIHIRPIPPYRRLLAKGGGILFQTAEPVRDGAQAFLDLREARGKQLEIWTGA